MEVILRCPRVVFPHAFPSVNQSTGGKEPLGYLEIKLLGVLLSAGNSGMPCNPFPRGIPNSVSISSHDSESRALYTLHFYEYTHDVVSIFLVQPIGHDAKLLLSQANSWFLSDRLNIQKH